jgi:hypothetical protein
MAKSIRSEVDFGIGGKGTVTVTLEGADLIQELMSEVEKQFNTKTGAPLREEFLKVFLREMVLLSTCPEPRGMAEIVVGLDKVMQRIASTVLKAMVGDLLDDLVKEGKLQPPKLENQDDLVPGLLIPLHPETLN